MLLRSNGVVAIVDLIHDGEALAHLGACLGRGVDAGTLCG
jgi:hypothetical protein